MTNFWQELTLEILTNPSAPILPLPVILNAISTSHHSKFMGCLVQIAPFWLLSDGAILTFSELAIASEKQEVNDFYTELTISCKSPTLNKFIAVKLSNDE